MTPLPVRLGGDRTQAELGSMAATRSIFPVCKAQERELLSACGSQQRFCHVLYVSCLPWARGLGKRLENICLCAAMDARYLAGWSSGKKPG